MPCAIGWLPVLDQARRLNSDDTGLEIFVQLIPGSLKVGIFHCVLYGGVKVKHALPNLELDISWELRKLGKLSADLNEVLIDFVLDAWEGVGKRLAKLLRQKFLENVNAATMREFLELGRPILLIANEKLLFPLAQAL